MNSGSYATNGRNGASTSIFDNYARGIRGNVVQSTSDALDSITKCDNLMKTSTILSYVVSVVAILLLIAVAFNFNYAYTVILAAIVTIVSIYQSILFSSKKCNGLFGNWDSLN